MAGKHRKKQLNLRVAFLVFAVSGYLLTIPITAAIREGISAPDLTAETLVWLFFTTVAEFFLNIRDRSEDKAILSGIALSAPLIEKADPYILARFAEIVDRYGEIRESLQNDPSVFFALAKSRIENRLLRAADWDDLCRGHIIYDNPLDEYPVAGILIEHASERIDAISKTSQDLRYLSSEAGLESLEKQRALIGKGVAIRRLFVCNPDKRFFVEDSGTSTDKRDLFPDVFCVARHQERAGVTARVLLAIDGYAYAWIPDLNIVDGAVMRVATPLSDDDHNAYMTGEVYDLTNSHFPPRGWQYDFEHHWKRGKSITATGEELGITCRNRCTNPCPILDAIEKGMESKREAGDDRRDNWFLRHRILRRRSASSKPQRGRHAFSSDSTASLTNK